MSHVARVNITTSSSTKSTAELIEALLNNGWSVNDHGHISSLPFGDEDAFKLIGLVMTWKDAGIGGEFLFFPDGEKLAIS